MDPFKNRMGASAARRIVRAVSREWPRFNARAFLRGIERGLTSLELKDRMRVIARRLAEALPEDPPRAFRILTAALRQDGMAREGLEGFEVWPLTQVVAGSWTMRWGSAAPEARPARRSSREGALSSLRARFARSSWRAAAPGDHAS